MKRGSSTPVSTIDLFAKHFLFINVKIDIDGQELKVVQGMQKTILHIKSILIEVSQKSKQPVTDILLKAGFSVDNRFNTMSPHSRERRAIEKIDAENIVFVR